MSTTDLDRGRHGERPRDLRVDFAHGVALLFIFSDHIRENVVAAFTPQALGFSDMAEVFVFLSGYVCGLTYSRRLVEQGFRSCLLRATRRATQVYVAKLASHRRRARGRRLRVPLDPRDPLRRPVDDRGRQRAPRETAVGLLLSRLELHQFCVLALYIPLLMALPIFLLVLRHWPKTTLTASALVYALVQFFPDAFRPA